MRIYVICPVRKCGDDERARVFKYVMHLEADGHSVFFPHRDLNQDDRTGVEICNEERAAMRGADEVHIWWDVESFGSHFDLGMAFALEKPLVLVNDPHDTNEKSYLKVIRAHAHESLPR